MIKISEGANKNYLAKVVQLKGLRKHPNADRLQTMVIDFNTVITGPDAKDGDICIFFPLESAINSELLAFTNSYRDKEMNADKELAGFFEKQGRVRAVKLRNEKSMGYLLPAEKVSEWLKQPMLPWEDYIGQEFDTIAEKIICKKYVVKTREYNPMTGKGKKPRISRLVDNQLRLHCDTENLRKEVYKINPGDNITITYKLHGTSFGVANVLVKKKLKLYEKILKKFGVDIKDTEYDHLHFSRKVVKNEFETSQKDHFYKYDLWGEIKEEIKEFVPKGYTVYGECVGFLKGGGPIQAGYDYGCKEGEHKIYIYRITFTNEDGLCNELSSMQVKQYCEHFGLNYVPDFYYGPAGMKYPDLDQNLHWHENFIKRLEMEYNDKPCFMCASKNPEEGIVVRKESLFNFDVWKLKSFAFLEFESKQLDSGQENLEDNQ